MGRQQKLIKFKCQRRKVLTVSEEHAGKKGKRPACGPIIKIPFFSAESTSDPRADKIGRFLRLAKMLAPDQIVDEAIEARKRSRFLRGAYLGLEMSLFAMGTMGEASRQKCFESVSRAFELGWMTVKLRDTISDLELYSADKIGNINTDLNSDHTVLCLEYCDVMHDVYKKDSD